MARVRSAGGARARHATSHSQKMQLVRGHEETHRSQHQARAEAQRANVEVPQHTATPYHHCVPRQRPHLQRRHDTVVPLARVTACAPRVMLCRWRHPLRHRPSPPGRVWGQALQDVEGAGVQGLGGGGDVRPRSHHATHQHQPHTGDDVLRQARREVRRVDEAACRGPHHQTQHGEHLRNTDVAGQLLHPHLVRGSHGGEPRQHDSRACRPLQPSHAGGQRDQAGHFHLAAVLQALGQAQNDGSTAGHQRSKHRHDSRPHEPHGEEHDGGQDECGSAIRTKHNADVWSAATDVQDPPEGGAGWTVSSAGHSMQRRRLPCTTHLGK